VEYDGGGDGGANKTFLWRIFLFLHVCEYVFVVCVKMYRFPHFWTVPFLLFFLLFLYLVQDGMIVWLYGAFLHPASLTGDPAFPVGDCLGDEQLRTVRGRREGGHEGTDGFPFIFHLKSQATLGFAPRFLLQKFSWRLRYFLLSVPLISHAHI
jgi:hypothetical protein